MAAVVEDEVTLVPLSVNASNGSAPVSFAGSPPAGFSQSDLTIINALAHDFLLNPNTPFPPPPIPAPNPRSQKIVAQKDQGNSQFKKGDWREAIKYYTLSAETAATRPLYEANVYARDEVAIALCNRSAAYLNAGEFVNALVDAEAVIGLKRPWVKGHFRKGKALQGMGRLEEAREALLLGLQFDPSAEDLQNAVSEVEALMRQKLNQAKITAEATPE